MLSFIFFAIWQWFGQRCFVYCCNSSPYVVFLPPFIEEVLSSRSNWASDYCYNLGFVFFWLLWEGDTVETQKTKILYYKPRIHLPTCGVGLTFWEKKLKDKGSVRLILCHKAGGKVSYFSVVEICVEWVHLGTMGDRIRKLEIASVERTGRVLWLWSKAQPMHRHYKSSTDIWAGQCYNYHNLPHNYWSISPDTRRYQEFPGDPRRS